jgi:hypothetical protein
MSVLYKTWSDERINAGNVHIWISISQLHEIRNCEGRGRWSQYAIGIVYVNK